MSPIEIVKIMPVHKDWIEKVLTLYWGSARLVSRGQIYDGLKLPGFVANIDQEPVGLCTYNIAQQQCESRGKPLHLPEGHQIRAQHIRSPICLSNPFYCRGRTTLSWEFPVDYLGDGGGSYLRHGSQPDH